eukprot:c36719_g1_i1 orf=95-283(-)
MNSIPNFIAFSGTIKHVLHSKFELFISPNIKPCKTPPSLFTRGYYRVSGKDQPALTRSIQTS